MPCEGRERRMLVVTQARIKLLWPQILSTLPSTFASARQLCQFRFQVFIASQFQFVAAVFYSQKMRQDRCFWIWYIHSLILLSVVLFSVNWHAKNTFNTLTLSSTALSLSKLFKEFLNIAFTRRSRSIYCGCQGLLNCDECTTLRREKYPNLFHPFWNHWWFL